MCCFCVMHHEGSKHWCTCQIYSVYMFSTSMLTFISIKSFSLTSSQKNVNCSCRYNDVVWDYWLHYPSIVCLVADRLRAIIVNLATLCLLHLMWRIEWAILLVDHVCQLNMTLVPIWSCIFDGISKLPEFLD